MQVFFKSGHPAFLFADLFPAYAPAAVHSFTGPLQQQKSLPVLKSLPKGYHIRIFMGNKNTADFTAGSAPFRFRALPECGCGCRGHKKVQISVITSSQSCTDFEKATFVFISAKPFFL